MPRTLHIETLPAKTYYRNHAPGWVVLVNGVCYFHGTKKAAEKFIKDYTGEPQ